MKNDVREIMDNSIIIDGLFHSLISDPPPTQANKDIVDLLIDGGVTVINATVVLDYYKNDFKSFCNQLYRFLVLEETLSDKLLIIRQYNDILKVKKEGKLGIILSMQGADSFEHDLRFITLLYKLGVRLVQITYNQQNNLGYGAFEPNDLGLTRFGQQSIFEMNRQGIVIDLSHAGHKTSLDAIEISKDPVVFSHSSVKELCEHPRNISNEQIKAVASKGGVVGLCPHSIMCKKDNLNRPSVDDFIDHIEYIIDLVGEDDNVGIGTDRWMRPTMAYKMTRVEFERTLPGFFGSFSGNEKHVEGFNYYDEWESLVDNLLRRNFNNEQISKILGGNFYRVFQQIWQR